ncbi:hypothetical protein PR048_021819 [Dryococelus australis]|uniref:DUF4371 domain-containing protein n=1 Tax=Dryococelus australis TaxID=614101 RepID=A0ABQ9GZA5_9NEOP|nr:hypothetical protein PR048_021819 [Dryococelus australis]
MQLNDQLNKEMENACSALMAIFTTLRLLCRQGLSIRGHEDVGYRTTFKTRLLLSKGKSVLCSLVCEMKKREHFAIMVDETCDTSIHEQVTFCIQSVDENLTLKRTLFGIVKDILAHLDLNIEKLQKFVADLQPKAIYVHCAAHSLNLVVQDCLPKDFLNTVRESPKRVQLFKNITEDKKIGLHPLCLTRWTMRASSIQVLINYERLTEFFLTYSEEYYSDAASK